MDGQGELLVLVIMYSVILSDTSVFLRCDGLELSSLILLESVDIERKIIGVNNALDVIIEGDPSDVQLDMLSCLSVLVELF